MSNPTLTTRLDMLSWGAQPLNVIGGQAVDRLVADTKARIAELEAELVAMRDERDRLRMGLRVIYENLSSLEDDGLVHDKRRLSWTESMDVLRAFLSPPTPEGGGG